MNKDKKTDTTTNVIVPSYQAMIAECTKTMLDIVFSKKKNEETETESGESN